MSNTAPARDATSHRRPKVWRVLLGFVLAPLVPLALLFGALALWTRSGLWLGAFVWVLAIGGYATTALVGAPVFLVLLGTVRATLANAVLAGVAVAVVPWFAIFALVRPDYSASNGRVTTANGVITLDGLVDLLGLMIPFGITGAVGGMVFWFVALSGTVQR